MPATCRFCLLLKAIYVLAVRAVLNLFFPQQDILSRFGRCAIHGYACHRPSTARFDLLCCSLGVRMSLFFCAGIVCVCTAWERGRLARFGCAVHVGIEKSVQFMWTAFRKAYSQAQDEGSANNANSQRVLRCSCDERSHGWRSAGVEPWMGSSTEKQLQRGATHLNIFSRLGVVSCCGRAARAPKRSPPEPRKQNAL